MACPASGLCVLSVCGTFEPVTSICTPRWSSSLGAWVSGSPSWSVGESPQPWNCEGPAPAATLCPSPSLLPIPSICYSLKPLTKREWVQKAFSWHLRATGQGLPRVSRSGALLALRGWVQAEVIRPCLSCLGLKPGEGGGSLGPARVLEMQVRRGLPGAGSGPRAHPALCSIYC